MKQMDSFHHLHFKFHYYCCMISSVFHEVFRSKFFNQIYVNTLCPSKPCPLSKRSSVVLSLPYQLWRMWAGHPQQVRSPRTESVAVCITLPETNVAMENPHFYRYLPGKMGIFMGYVSFKEGTPPENERIRPPKKVPNFKKN